MPIIPSKYYPKKIFRNPDISTIFAAKFRKVEGVKQQRERIRLSDGDFMDLDWSFAKQKSDTCIILLHGLEGHAQRPYILGVAKLFNNNGIDACAANYRHCSGEVNQVISSYHSGKTEDVADIVNHILAKGKYQKIIINGFSLGGNLTLKYIGEGKIPEEIKAAIAVSTPVDLEGCMIYLHKKRNLLYSTNFLMTLKKKLLEKQKHFPEQLSAHEIKKIKSLKEYDEYYTAKANGFIDAFDYYRKSSSKPFLKNIKIPTLIINAKNDPFLSESCYPIAEAEQNENIFLDIPEYGGHVGFIDTENIFYNERRTLEFSQEILK